MDLLQSAGQKKRPLSVVYFREASGAMAKRLAIRIRDTGVECNLIWSHLFHDKDDIVSEAKAVIIEAGSPRSKDIADAYLKFAHDVEIHYVSRDGEFIDKPESEETGDRKDQPDANAAIRGLKAKAETARPTPAETKSTETENGGEGDEAEVGSDESGDISDKADQPESETEDGDDTSDRSD